MHSGARLGALIGVVVLLVAAPGCGSDEANPGPTTRGTRFPPTVPVDNREIKEGQDSCGLVTRAEVEGAIGLPVNPGDGVTTRHGSSSCAWRLRTGANMFVSVLTANPGRQVFDNALNQLGSGVEPLSGMGDRAFVANDTVYVLRGDRLLIVQVLTNQPVPARRQAALKLTQSAMNRG